MTCLVCQTVTHADQTNLPDLVRWLYRQLDQANDDTLALRLARYRIAELEDTVFRLNNKIRRKDFDA